MNSKLKPGLAAVALAFGLFGLPGSPGASLAPTVGGPADAYGPPCWFVEHVEMDAAWLDQLAATTIEDQYRTIITYNIAVAAYAACLAG